MQHQVIYIRVEAPRKPPEGEPCNGCGVCCLAEPCPVGVIVSRRFKGACKALVWSPGAGRYHCGLLVDCHGEPAQAAGKRPAGPRALLHALWLRWVRRLISAGSGCDASLAVSAWAADESANGLANRSNLDGEPQVPRVVECFLQGGHLLSTCGFGTTLRR